MIDDNVCDEMERQMKKAPKSHERREIYQARQEISKKNEAKPTKRDAKLERSKV